MAVSLDLIDETLSHFQEGARAVRAYATNNTYIITRVKNSNSFWVAIEENGFQKQMTDSLEGFFTDVFGIEATY